VFTGITGHGGALVTAIVVLTGAAILRGGAAAADPNQDNQFLALLDQEGIPALENVPSLIATAHKICRKLDGGMSVDYLVGAMVNYAYNADPHERGYPPGRLARTEARFITAAVEAYCPRDRGKIASGMANPAPGSTQLTRRGAAYTHNSVNSDNDLREPPPLDMIIMPAPWREPTGSGRARPPHSMDGSVVVAGRYGHHRSEYDAPGTLLASLLGAAPSGEIAPPPIPAPPPPTAQTLTPPRPIAIRQPPKQPPPPPKRPPPPPKQPPPPPKQPPPPPKQVEPPAVGPQPGGAAGSGGGGITGGGGTGSGGGGTGSGGGGRAEPTPDMPPGFVRLAP
jgi:uncharacterized membrane protein YgcG